jgi:bla regulator protein blaR1
MLRVRNIQAQLIIWTVVLFAGLSMPLLMQWTTIAVPAPSSTPVWIAPPPAVFVAAETERSTFRKDSSPANWDAILFGSYLVIAGLLLLRLMIGLLLTWRMVRGATRFLPEWTNGMDVRVTSVSAPVTCGLTVLLPLDCVSWDETMQNAVLSHERAHVRRADFFIQVLAGVHRAIFWFSPFSWWLQNRLAELAELASDDAAIEQVSDRAAYAEILLGLSRNKSDYRWIGVSMARPKTVVRRVERILSQTVTTAKLGRLKQTILVLVILAFVAFAAGCTLRSRAQTAPSAPSAASTSRAPSSASPAAPAKQAESARPVRSFRSKGDNNSFAIVADSISMIGDDAALVLRDKIRGDYIWFKRDSKDYYITDPSTVQRAIEIFKPQEELGRQQTQLGEEQAKLGEEQGKLGEEQAQVSVSVPDMSRDIDALQRVLTNSAGKQLRQEELSHIQAELAQLQARVGALQARAGHDQATLGIKQANLGAQQANLGAQQARLGMQQAQLAAEASRLMQFLLNEALSDGRARPVQ